MPDTHADAAAAEPKPAQASAPDLFVLSGGDLHVSYSTSGIDGRPHLTYQDAHRTLSFTGDQIRAVEVPDLGTVVSVTLVLTADSGSTTFSLLVPRVRLPGGQPVPVSTEGITAVHRFSLIPALNQGQTDAYRVTRLAGTASLVFFLVAGREEGGAAAS